LVLEINTLPGMTSHSLLPKIAAKAGTSYGDLVEQMVADAGLWA
jgi:D-alanine-D-alanine ligase